MNTNTTNLVTITDGKAVTTSLKIADVFGKAHRSVLMIIRNLEAPADFVQHNFVRHTYTAANGKSNPAYQITRDGFTLLAMGFTGKKAMQFKLACIAEFNRMEAELRKAATATATEQVIDPADVETILKVVDICFKGGREEFLRKLAEAGAENAPDLVASTRAMCNSLNRRIEAGENIPAHILKYAWNMANCSRLRVSENIIGDSDEFASVFSVFERGVRIPRNKVYDCYCEQCDAPMSPRMFWPRARKVVDFREGRTATGRFIIIL